jgi:hypothetical protein
VNFLLLRGAVPTDRNPNEIIFDSISESDDMWSLLFYNLLNNNDYGEIWYYNGIERTHKMAHNLIEKWIPDFGNHKTEFIPDIIFARGAFKEYHKVFYKCPQAFKIRYGAGRRFLPQQGFDDYDIILQDSCQQVRECRTLFPKALTTLYIKPAADNIFYPIECEKEYDICFPANSAQDFKGHKFVYSTIPSDLKLLNLGNNSHGYKYPKNVTSYRVLRTEMAKNIAKCRVGIVAVESHIDSCPRVIPEMLACGLPIVVLEDVKFWRDKYIVSGVTGELATKDNFWNVVKYVLNNLDKYNPRKYYEENLSVKHAAIYLREKIDIVLDKYKYIN